MSIEMVFVPDSQMTDAQKRGVDFIDETCLSGDSSDPEAVERDMYDWGAPELGMFLLTDGEKVVGRASVHKTATAYAGREYALGGFGGLAVLEGYRGHGYGRMLAEAALLKAREAGVDVACMCVNMESGITDFYEKLGFRFLNRPAYFVNWRGEEKTDDTVMVMGLNDKPLAEAILKGHEKFHYGNEKGHW